MDVARDLEAGLRPGRGKVQHIFCLRQLTRKEKKYRLKLRPNQTYVDFSAGSLLGPELELTPEQVDRMADAASRFNEVRAPCMDREAPPPPQQEAERAIDG